MARAVAKLKKELREILVTAVFFATGFILIIVAERLFTRGSGIEIAGFARAVVGGLIVAKVLLLVDLLPFVNAFPHKPLVHNIVWKSALYVSGSVVFAYLEPFIKHLFKGMGLHVSHALAWQEVMRPRTWAILIFLLMLMVGFVTMREISRVVGKDELKQMFFGERRRPLVGRRFRDVA
jgi:hypothetical protein